MKCTQLLFFLSAIFFATNPSFGQNIKSYDKVEIQTLYINAKDSVVRFQVLSDSKKVKYLPAYTYWWYKSNTILRTTGGADGRLLNGEYVCFYPDNNLKEKGSFFKGVKDKLWITWHSNGKINEQLTWKKGVMNGERLIYDKDGKVLLKERYVNGKLKKNKVKQVVKDKGKSTQPKESKQDNSGKSKQSEKSVQSKSSNKEAKKVTGSKRITAPAKKEKITPTDKKKK